MKKGLVFIIIVLIVALIAALQQVKYANSKWSLAMGNVKSYSELLAASEKKNSAMQLTVNQFKYYKDSVLQELDKTRKELKIKDKNLKALQYVSSNFTKKDTVILKDTIFKDPAFSMDTTIADEWYKMHLGLKYPSIITASPEFRSIKHVVISMKKETVNPPKKFFLFRWFQKKHKVIQVDVIEKNPYVQNEVNRYIEIVR